MIRFPLRFRPLGRNYVLVNDAGRFFRADAEFLDRYATGDLSPADDTFLQVEGHAVVGREDLAYLSHAYGIAQRVHRPRPLNYLILVPTLRCNLACSYCQVSRAPEDQRGFDWSEETLAAVLRLIDSAPGPALKIEFQGGEPLLRTDLIEQVISHAAHRFPAATFVICTNLSRLDEAAWRLIARPDVFVSTSLDGDQATHQQNRTGSAGETSAFLTNLCAVLSAFGPEKISALPTIDYRAPPAPDTLIDAFLEHGFTSIYLRPVNYQGFARKRHAYAQSGSEAWNAYYEAFIMRLIERNWADRSRLLEEYYLKLCLHRILQSGHDDHVDLRNPNILGRDYLVVDHDGVLYPTDEARMVTRSGVADLRIGHVVDGLDRTALAALNSASDNTFDADCVHCAYQPYCGRDIVDDIARYGRIDLPRRETAFCQRHIAIFDLAFRLLYATDEKVNYSLRRWLGLPGEGPLPVVTR